MTSLRYRLLQSKIQSRKSPISARLLILVGLGLLTAALLLTLSGGRETLTALAEASWPLVALAMLVHYSGFAVRGRRWQLILALLGHRLPYRTVTTLLVSGWFISALLPARAGDVARVTILHQGVHGRAHRSASGVPVADAIGSIVLERVLDIVAILLLGGGFGYLILRSQLPGWVLVAYGVGTAGLALLGGIVLFAPALIGRLRRLCAHPQWQRGLDFAHQLATSVRILPQHPRVALWVLAESIYIWLCDALLLWLVIWSLGTHTTVGMAGFVALTVDVFATVPLTPGGVGQLEVVHAGLLALFALPGLNVSAAVLLTRAISYWSFLLFSGAVTLAAGIGQLLPRLEAAGATTQSAPSTDWEPHT